MLTNVETTLGYDQWIHSTCFWLWLIEKNGKHEKYSMEKDVRKYNAIYMKVIWKWQREFADSKINSCTDGTIRPYLCFLTFIRFHIIKKQNMCFFSFFFLFSFCFLFIDIINFGHWSRVEDCVYDLFWIVLFWIFQVNNLFSSSSVNYTHLCKKLLQNSNTFN